MSRVAPVKSFLGGRLFESPAPPVFTSEEEKRRLGCHKTWQRSMSDSIFDVTRYENRNGVISWRVCGCNQLREAEAAFRRLAYAAKWPSGQVASARPRFCDFAWATYRASRIASKASLTPSRPTSPSSSASTIGSCLRSLNTTISAGIWISSKTPPSSLPSCHPADQGTLPTQALAGTSITGAASLFAKHGR